MIPAAVITGWRARHPWPLDEQVEQDLVIARALVEIFNAPELSGKLAFRGGTALHKLYIDPPARYSEDIDLVQIVPHEIGPTFDAIRTRLEPWLGKGSSKRTADGAKLTFRFKTEVLPVQDRKLKVEINTRESFSVLERVAHPFEVSAPPWFEGRAEISTFRLEELLATKLRALYQRQKGRDLFDLALALDVFDVLDCDAIIECFRQYTARSETPISRRDLEDNLAKKAAVASFMNEVQAFIRSGQRFDPTDGLERVRRRLVERL